MIVLVVKKLLPKNINGITIFPFVLLRDAFQKNNLILLNHEKIHLRQQLELLVIFFYLWYAIEFLVHWIRLKNPEKAYFRISFEREAYEKETELNYLNKRKAFSFLPYL